MVRERRKSSFFSPVRTDGYSIFGASPWSVDDPDPKLGRQRFIVRDADGHALTYVYFDEPGQRSAHVLTRDEALR
jgi:hypothetical protein